ncbi:hypothetical protein [Nocardioides sp. YIM 152588]|uniref:hypothetical protein n=1 Tax=Nocardioides sp. YIM 152588 TaxID=3158259 RepID=UPI0032E51A1A
MPDRPDLPPAGDQPPEDLRAALHDAAAGIEPPDRLGEIRRRTAPGHRRARTRWLSIALGAGLATAAVVAVGLALGTLLGGSAPVTGNGPASPPTTDGVVVAGGDGDTAALYFIADTATGPRLFREFATVPGAGDAADAGGAEGADGGSDDSAVVLAALDALTAENGPLDPDYRTLWPADSFAAAEVDGDTIVVDLGAEALRRPPQISRGEARLGLQQVVYTAEAAAGRAVPVAFTFGGAPADTVLGVPTEGAVARDRQYAVTAPVGVSDPTEGQRLDADLTARGTLAEYVRTVRWTLTAPGGEVVARGRAELLDAGEGGTTDHARGWQTPPIDVSGLPAGEYVFEASARSVGQTTDRPGLFSDDRTVVIP